MDQNRCPYIHQAVFVKKWHFQISAEKKFLASQNKSFALFEWIYHQFCNLQPLKLSKNVEKLSFRAGKLFFAEIGKIAKCHFWANVTTRQPDVWPSRASPAQKALGFRVVWFQKLFRDSILFLLVHSFGRYIFELFVRETNLKKKHSVTLHHQAISLLHSLWPC